MRLGTDALSLPVPRRRQRAETWQWLLLWAAAATVRLAWWGQPIAAEWFATDGLAGGSWLLNQVRLALLRPVDSLPFLAAFFGPLCAALSAPLAYVLALRVASPAAAALAAATVVFAPPLVLAGAVGAGTSGLAAPLLLGLLWAATPTAPRAIHTVAGGLLLALGAFMSPALVAAVATTFLSCSWLGAPSEGRIARGLAHVLLAGSVLLVVLVASSGLGTAALGSSTINGLGAALPLAGGLGWLGSSRGRLVDPDVSLTVSVLTLTTLAAWLTAPSAGLAGTAVLAAHVLSSALDKRSISARP